MHLYTAGSILKKSSSHYAIVISAVNPIIWNLDCRSVSAIHSFILAYHCIFLISDINRTYIHSFRLVDASVSAILIYLIEGI